jgi:hypothetical protein
MTTYNAKRRCLHCSAPIADQAHGTMKFCPRSILPDGCIKSCKDDYHSAARRITDAPFNRVKDFHKQMNQRIFWLIKQKGRLVSIEDINRCGINLSRPIQFAFLDDKFYKGWFVGYLIEKTLTGDYKISEHDILF